MLRRSDGLDLSGGEQGLIFFPTHASQAGVALDHADAFVHGAHQRAHVAPHTGILVDLEDVDVAGTGAGQDHEIAAAYRRAVRPGETGEVFGLRHPGPADRLMAAVLAGDVAQPAVGLDPEKDSWPALLRTFRRVIVRRL